MKGKSQSEVTESCPTLSDPMDCSLPGSSVHGIFQARVLEWGTKTSENMCKSIGYILSDLGIFVIKESQCKCKTSKQKSTDYIMKDSGRIRQPRQNEINDHKI